MTEEINKERWIASKQSDDQKYDGLITLVIEQSDVMQRLCEKLPRTADALAEEFRAFKDFLENAQESCKEDSPRKEVAYLDEAFRTYIQLWTKIEKTGLIEEVRERMEVIGDNICALKERPALANRQEVLDDALEDGIMSEPPEQRAEMRKPGFMIGWAKSAAEEWKKNRER